MDMVTKVAVRPQAPRGEMKTQVRQALQELEATLDYLTQDERALVTCAFDFACRAHGDQERKSGKLYITHPLSVATLLGTLRMDAATLAASLLHDVIEDTRITYEEVERAFTPEIAQLVAGVTKLGENVKELHMLRPLGNQDMTYEQKTAASLVNLFLSMTTDLRVMIIKLADRQHNMRTLRWLPPEKQRRKARETFELFVPVAARLGIRRFEEELAEHSLRILEPEMYSEIKQMLEARRKLLERNVEDTISQIKHKLFTADISGAVTPLPENILDLYQYIQAHGWESARTYDGLRLQIVVKTRAECYEVLGNIHSLFQPVPGRVMDYIAAPQEGLYRALHTVVIGLRGHPLEIRINTHQMEYLAQYGVIAYLQRDHEKNMPEPSDYESPALPWLTELAELPQDDPEAFLDLFKSEITPERIRVFTPKGDVIELPRGATPLDFAYAVHTEIGHSCRRALVNGRYVPLNTLLQSGDQVEIIKSLKLGPERAWLDEDLGYTNHPYTRRHIRRWFAHQPEGQQIRQGRQQIEQEILLWGNCSGWTAEDVAELARQRGLTEEDFCRRVGRGEIDPRNLGIFVLEQVLRGEEGQPQRLSLEIQAMDRAHLLKDVAEIVAEDNLNMPSAWAKGDAETGLATVQVTLDTNNLEQVVRVAHRVEHTLSILKVQRCPGPTSPGCSCRQEKET